MVPAISPTQSPTRAALSRAFSRATAERIVIYRGSPTLLGVAAIVAGVWTEKPYTLVITGPGAADLTCDCKAGARGQTCKHLAAGIFSRKYGVFASRPTAAPASSDAGLQECYGTVAS